LNLSHHSNEHRILYVLRALNTTPLCHLSDTNRVKLKEFILILIYLFTTLLLKLLRPIQNGLSSLNKRTYGLMDFENIKPLPFI
jgi:hypothetical protein